MNTFRSGDKVYTVADIERLEQQLAKANERAKRLELIARGLCYTEGTAINDKAYSEWLKYQDQLKHQEQLRKEQE